PPGSSSLLQVSTHSGEVQTNHGARRWRDAGTKEVMDFTKLMDWLGRTAAKIKINESGPIQIECFGIDAVERARKS
ncbi:hypothetical protein, partial [uncultured Bradyrhizobium sp.]|uniref:hypothetical protein n=1 Tax=uncultured Bradyrhizobium sp. TaxID=199684 RepID=UPI0035CC81B0